MTEQEIKQNLGRGKDLRGQKSGQLTPLYPLKERNRGKGIIWHCLCDCGNECDVNARHLDGQHTRSCGCAQKDHIQQQGQKRKLNLLNHTFGHLTVIEETTQRKNGQIVWKCKCKCGNTCFITSANLINGFTKSCGCIKSRGESVIKQILLDNNIKFETQKTFKSCYFTETNRPAYFDFYLPDYHILIEYDGIQHFKARNSGWNTDSNLLQTQKRDKIKNQWCKSHNIPLIRIPYTHLENICLNDLLNNSKFVVK